MSSNDLSSSGYDSETSHNSTTSNITDDEIMKRLYGQHPQSQKPYKEVKSADESDVEQFSKHGIVMNKDNLFNGIHLPKSMLSSNQRQKGQYYTTNIFKQNATIVQSPEQGFLQYNNIPRSHYYNTEPLQYGYRYSNAYEPAQNHLLYHQERTQWQNKTFYNSKESQSEEYSIQQAYYFYTSSC